FLPSERRFTMMLHVPDVLSRAQVQEVRQALDTTGWVDGKATVGAQGAQVKNNRQLPEFSAEGQRLGNIILAALKQQLLFISAALPLRIVPPLFNRYEGGEHYGLHIDGSIRGVPGSTQPLRTDLSCTLFLTDPEDY